MLIIGQHNAHKFAPKIPDGQSKGLVPRDFNACPRGCYSSLHAVDFPTIPRAEWTDRIKDKIARSSQLSMMAKNAGMKVLDQNGRGYCWSHSVVSAVQIARVVMNEPLIGLSAYSVACKIKNFRDQGGWGAQAADFIAQNGVCDETVWPQRAVDRSLDNAANWANAKKYRITSQLADMQASQYDRNMTFEQYMTLWLLGNPTVNDYNWWGHSVCGADAVDGVSMRMECRNDDSGKLMTTEEFDECWSMDDPVTAGFGCNIANSWGESWGQGGFGVLAGNKAVPDGGVGIMVVTAS